MKQRILRGNLLAMAVALILSLLLCTLFFDRIYVRSMDDSMTRMARMMAHTVTPGPDMQQQALALSEANDGMRITFIAADGTALADSHVTAASIDNLRGREEVAEAERAGVGNANRQSQMLGDKWIFVAAKAPWGGYVRIARAYEGYFGNLITFLPAILLAAVGAMAFALPFSSRVARSIVEPLNTFSDGIDRVMAGNIRLNPASSPYEELQSMAVKINRLSTEVEEGLIRVQQEHNRIETILENMNEGFVMSGEGDRLLLINAAACKIFGCSYPPPGKSLVHATRNLVLLDAVAGVRQSGASARVEISSAEGDIIEASLTPVSTHEDGEEKSAVVMLLSDVTDKRLASEMRQDFFQSASHELKTPITSIRGFAELLCAGPMEEAQRQDFLERILKESQRMDSLIEDILMISRLESGDAAFGREKIDLYDVVNECCDDARPLALENDIDIFFDGVHFELCGSRRELSELAGNLISNAVKYNRPGGHVEVKLLFAGRTPVFTVFNTGDAIPPGDAKRIFEKFYRLDKGRSKAIGGTGLGLAIVRQVAARYNAEVAVIPKKGIGNIFKVTFPPLGAQASG